jgi:transposase
MSSSYLPYHPTQAQLFPPSPLDWLPKDHLAYFVMEVVRQLDVAALHRYAQKSAKGGLPFHPLMLTNLLFYGYCAGVGSSRMIARKTYDDVACRVLAGGHHPDHVVLRDFRRRNLKALTDVFTQVFAVALKAGMARLGSVVLVEKAKGRSAKRMVVDTGRLREIAQRLLMIAAETDKNEDRQFGKKSPSEALPEALHEAGNRSALIKQWIAELAPPTGNRRLGKAKGADKRTG